MQKSLTKNAFYNSVYTGINILFPLLTSIFVSRVLMPVGVGKVAYIQNIVSYFVVFAALGLPTYGIREFAKVRDIDCIRNKLFSELWVINAISTTISLLAYCIFVKINNGFDGEWTLCIACGISIVFNYINIDWLFQGAEEYGYITARSILVKMLSLVALITFVRDQQDYVMYAFISSMALGGNYIFNIVRSKAIVKFRFTALQLKKHLKPIILILVITFFTSIYNKIDITMLGALSDAEVVGYYSYAHKIVEAILAVICGITATLMPRLSYYFEHDRQAFMALLRKGYRILCFLILPACAGLCLVSEEVVLLLYGDAFAPSVLTVSLMCPLIFIKGFGNLLCYQTVYSTNNEKIIVPAAVAASVLNIIFNAFLIPKYAQNGAVIASIASELITNTIQLLYVQKRVNIKLEIKPLVYAVVTTGFMIIGILLISNMKLPIFSMLIVKVVCGSAIYVILNLLVKNPICADVIFKIKGMICKK